MDKTTEAAIFHFGEIDGNVIDALVTQNVNPGTIGGFKINDMRISPHNYGEPPARHRIVIDYDPEFPYVLLRVIGVGKERVE